MALLTGLLHIAATSAGGKSYAALKLPALKRMLYVRGVECAHCSTKSDYVDQLEIHGHLPEQPSLAEEWTAKKEYAKKVKEFNMTRDDFIKRERPPLKPTPGSPLSQGRVARAPQR